MHVRDNMIERDIILTHQSGCELRGPVNGDVKIVAPVYTHFDPDGRPVSRAFVISMLSGFVSREGLVNGMIIHSEMPGEKSSAIVTASEPLVHSERVMQCVGATRRIVATRKLAEIPDEFLDRALRRLGKQLNATKSMWDVEKKKI